VPPGDNRGLPAGTRDAMVGRNISFTVDTHVFRELGELLVGRDSTALLELIKNAYDADATRIVVTAVDLKATDRGCIVIEDNGCGMDEARFVNGFLRIASRYKEEGSRRSGHFGRRYTGSKGIGRLAAHKLARFMEVDSVHSEQLEKSTESLHATIDWERIEDQSTLDALTDEIRLNTVRLPRGRRSGTVITLTRLRRPWTDKEQVKFVSECRSFQVPEVLRIPLPPRVLAKPLLFAVPVLRDATNADPGCEIVLEGDFAEGDDYWLPLIDVTNWVLEIDSKTDKSVVRYAVSPTKPTARLYSHPQARRFEHPHPQPRDGPFFQARILVRDEQIRDKKLLDWSRQTSGVRVYMEGFRVLPYGDPGDDWLSIDANYTRRSWSTDSVFADLVAEEDNAGDWQLLASPNRSYTGAVFLTQEDSPTLRMLVNREGFVTEEGYETLVEIVKRGIDLLTRTRAAATAEARQREREERERKRRPAASPAPSAEPGTVAPPHTDGDAHLPTNLVDATASAMETIREARQLLATAADPAVISQRLELTQSAIGQVMSAAERVADSAAMLRVLASLGTQMAAFVHEIRGLLATAVAIHEAVDRLRVDGALPKESRTRLNAVSQSLGDLRQQVERQAAYLIDVTSTDARRRRSRQPLAERFDAAARLIASAAARRHIQLLNEIPPKLKSPPMFPAELTVIFSNVLSNAVKAAGEGGVIRARGESRPGGEVVVVVENTGVAVDLGDSERWFLPFESTTAEMDSAFGYGMGLGLTITRAVLEQYGATIHFVPPTAGFSTAIEIRLPSGRENP
jgi:signal transduction histidine kinase